MGLLWVKITDLTFLSWSFGQQKTWRHPSERMPGATLCLLLPELGSSHVCRGVRPAFFASHHEEQAPHTRYRVPDAGAPQGECWWPSRARPAGPTCGCHAAHCMWTEGPWFSNLLRRRQ